MCVLCCLFSKPRFQLIAVHFFFFSFSLSNGFDFTIVYKEHKNWFSFLWQKKKQNRLFSPACKQKKKWFKRTGEKKDDEWLTHITSVEFRFIFFYFYCDRRSIFCVFECLSFDKPAETSEQWQWRRRQRQQQRRKKIVSVQIKNRRGDKRITL